MKTVDNKIRTERVIRTEVKIKKKHSKLVRKKTRKT